MAGTRAIGAKLAYVDGGVKYITHLTSLGAVKVTNEEIDVTDHDSPNGASEMIAGAQTTENISFAGNIVQGDNTFGRIFALVKSRESKTFTATYANGDTAVFTGYFASVAMGEQTTDGLMGYEGELKVSGVVTYTNNGSSA